MFEKKKKTHSIISFCDVALLHGTETHLMLDKWFLNSSTK